jgi:hypothetical protein
MDAIHLNLILVDWTITGWPGPAERDGASIDACKGDIRRFRNIDTEDVDQVGDRLPKSLP